MARDTTEHLGLPLPAEMNSLEEDLPRLREVLTILDEETHHLGGFSPAGRPASGRNLRRYGMPLRIVKGFWKTRGLNCAPVRTRLRKA